MTEKEAGDDDFSFPVIPDLIRNLILIH